MPGCDYATAHQSICYSPHSSKMSVSSFNFQNLFKIPASHFSIKTKIERDGMWTVLSLESKTRTYMWPTPWPRILYVYSLPMTFTPNILDVMNQFSGRKNVRLGINDKPCLWDRLLDLGRIYSEILDRSKMSKIFMEQEKTYSGPISFIIIIIIIIFVFQISGCQTAPWFTMCALRPP